MSDYEKLHPLFGAWQCETHAQTEGYNGMIIIDPLTTIEQAKKHVAGLQEECAKTYPGQCNGNCAIEKLRIALEKLE